MLSYIISTLIGYYVYVQSHLNALTGSSDVFVLVTVDCSLLHGGEAHTHLFLHISLCHILSPTAEILSILDLHMHCAS